jgi:predicted nucleic acid-binding protein
MKVVFDTNVYIAEALLGRAAERMISATLTTRWRVYCSTHIRGEVQTVMLRLGFAKRLATHPRSYQTKIIACRTGTVPSRSSR